MDLYKWIAAMFLTGGVTVFVGVAIDSNLLMVLGMQGMIIAVITERKRRKDFEVEYNEFDKE